MTMPMTTPIRHSRPCASRPILQGAFRLDDEPPGAEQPVAEEKGQPRQYGKGRQKVDGGPAEHSPLDSEALNEGAEHHSLRENCDERANLEGAVPERTADAILKAKLEGDAAEDERDQHHQDWEIHGGYDDGESQRKRREEGDAAEDQPGLVAVPDRRNRVHDHFAVGRVACKTMQHADAEIEAIEQDVEDDAQGNERRPDTDETEGGLGHRTSSDCGADGSLRTGSCGRPASIGAAAVGPGPLRTRLSM